MAVLCFAGIALGAVKREGTWPEEDKAITLDLSSVTRAEAVRKVSEAAGWSIVSKGLPEDRIDLHVKGQPATKVLDLVLSDTGYVARRDGDLIQIQRDDGAAQDTHAAPVPSAFAAPPAQPAPTTLAPAPNKKHKHHRDESDNDRTVFGGSLRVEPNEVVDDVNVFGGSVDILGKATGDVTVFGGSVHVHPGAHVDADLTVIGGEVTIDDDASIDGDVAVLGGDLHRSSGAKIGGEVKRLGDESGEDRSSEGPLDPRRIFRAIGVQLTKTAFLFLLGAIVIAIATRRMQLLQSEIALRPMRSMAVGIASMAVGVVLIVLLCVTIVGIPVALVGIVIGILAAYAGICAALSVMGSALVAHRSENPYVHLAVGCGVFLIAGSIPYFGSLVTLLILLAGFGAFAATRGAGFIPAQR
jgi:hypothetical protein